MFSLNTLVVSLLSASMLVIASPIEQRWDHVNSPSNSVSNSCNVGMAQCCQTIYQSNDQQFQSLTSLLGLVIPADGLMAGVQCSPILNTVPLLSGSSTCNSKPICCTGNDYSGLVNVGCSPISA